MAYIELQLLLPAGRLDAWSDALLAAGALSVTIEDANRDSEDESAVYGEPGQEPAAAGWKNNRVSVLLDESTAIETWLAAVANRIGDAVPESTGRTTIEEQDWVRRSQAQFGPIAIGRLAIVPTWHEPPDPAACIVRIDPGTAFGTGAHPTTRLCLAWMDANLGRGASVLDYGCGSGILSICAARLGAGPVAGVDIDPQAVEAARANAARNGVQAQYTTPDEFARDPSRTFDLVVANILANPLCLLAPTLARRVRAGGHLILSGILERQAESVIDAYRRADPRLRLHICGRDEGWVAVAGGASVAAR
jgi:ribosomal protein L11 methyltransferase